MNLCLGTVQLGLKYGVQGNEQPNSSHAIDILDAAYNNGIRIFDTASAYGSAEQILSEFFKKKIIDRKSISIVTKLKPFAFDGASTNDYKAILDNEVRASMSILGVSYLDGYMFHNAQYIYDLDAVNALLSIKEGGAVQSVGVSIYTPEEAMKTLSYEGIDIIQIPYNVLDKRLDQCGFFEQAHKRKVQVYARSALLQGLLTMQIGEVPDYLSFTVNVLKEYHDICREYNTTPYIAAVQYVMLHSGIDYLVFGVDNMSQMKDYIKLSNEYNSELLKKLSKSFYNIDERIVMPNMWR